MESWAASRALAIALLAAAAGSCDQTIVTDFRIRFDLDVREGSFCETASCADYGMVCGAQLSVRIYDTEGPSTRGVEVGSVCARVPSADELCKLGEDSQLRIADVPPHHVRVEVAVWNPSDVPPEEPCPTVTFDATGRPRVDSEHRPALAGAKLFDVSSGETEVRVPLQCTNVARLDDVECEAEPTTTLTARVEDMGLGQVVSDERAEDLDVRAAPPTPAAGSTTAQRIDVNDLISLPLIDSAEPTFEIEFPGQMSGRLCTVVRDSAPQVTETATCDDFTAGQRNIELRGILVSSQTLEPILAAMGSGFPEAGLVVGRVVDQAGSAVAGVRVIPSNGVVVEYLDEAGTGLGGTATSSRGYFISRNAPFGTTWQARDPGGLVTKRVEKAGLVNEMVSPVILRMVDPDAPGPDDGGDDDTDLGDDQGDAPP